VKKPRRKPQPRITLAAVAARTNDLRKLVAEAQNAALARADRLETEFDARLVAERERAQQTHRNFIEGLGLLIELLDRGDCADWLKLFNDLSRFGGSYRYDGITPADVREALEMFRRLRSMRTKPEAGARDDTIRVRTGGPMTVTDAKAPTSNGKADTHRNA
jgi:hypothetical protein